MKRNKVMIRCWITREFSIGSTILVPPLVRLQKTHLKSDLPCYVSAIVEN